MFVETLNRVAVYFSSLVVAVLWQSTLLAAVVAVAAWLLRRSSPAIRYWLWQIVAIKLLLAPLWTLVVPVAWLPHTGLVGPPHPAAQSPAAIVAPRDEPTPAPAPALATAGDHKPAADTADANPPVESLVPRPLQSSPSFTWQAWLMCGWAAIVVAQVVLVVWQARKLSGLLQRATPASPALVSLVDESAARLGLSRASRVRVLVAAAADECSPFVCGLWRPVMVLPQSLETLLHKSQLEPVLIHELAHIKRHDLLWGWIPQLARMLYFFHPIAHWVAFRIRLEAELAADGWAMSTTGRGAGAYADLLVRVVSQLAEPAMLRTGSAASAGFDGQSPLSEKK